jgi:YegS/Rv2252/BmrU family lipid kinase
MPNKVKLILNPIADHGRASHAVARLQPIVSEYGGAEWGGTVYPGHATDLARQAGEQGFDNVIAVGGDGTVHEVINGLMQLPENKRPLLGVVPVGSGNDYAHFLKLPLDPEEALHHALKGEASRLDVGKITDENGRSEYFNNTLGIGFDAIVTIRTQKIKIVHGFAMYFLAVMQTIATNFDCIPMKVRTDQEAWSQPSLMLSIGNGPREGGGFLITPDAKMDDGLLHYVTIGKLTRLRMLQLVPEVQKGTHGRHKEFRMGTMKAMSVDAERPLLIHLDGEVFAGFGTQIRHIEIEVFPNAIRVAR